jgi:hypothetical protein
VVSLSFDWKRLSTQDRVIVVGAAVVFVAAFLPWYGVSFEGLGVTVSGWSAGFSAWAGALLLTAAGVLLVLRRAGASLPSVAGAGPAVAVAAVAGLGLLLVIVRWISFPRYRGLHVGARYGIYIALIAGLAEVTAAVMELRASGEQMPWTQAEPAASKPESPPEAPAAPDE